MTEEDKKKAEYIVKYIIPELGGESFDLGFLLLITGYEIMRKSDHDSAKKHVAALLLQ